MNTFFSSLPALKPDPLFSIAAEAKLAGAGAIDGTLGIFMDEAGKPVLFPSVRSAIKDLEKDLAGFNYSYPLLTGLPEFRSSVISLLVHKDADLVASIATAGGTGALAVNLRLMYMLLEGTSRKMILPVPAWANHLPPSKAAGLQVIEVPYLQNCKASIEGILDAVKKMTEPFGLLLQVGCHNPTGLDFMEDDWDELICALQQVPCIALLDSAYQGFKDEPEQDIVPVQKFIDAGIATLATWSASKNHSIYGMRTGLACAFVSNAKEKETVEGNYCSITRTMHSAAPTFGQAIVALTQKNYSAQWRDDLRAARVLMQRKRSLLRENLPDSFHASLQGYGMFAMLPLTSEQVVRLKTEERVFFPLDGRINIAGIPERRIGELGEKILNVL